MRAADYAESVVVFVFGVLVGAALLVSVAGCQPMRTAVLPVADALCASALRESPAFRAHSAAEGRMLVPYADEACTIIEVVEAVDAATQARAADPGAAAVEVLP
jgi:hypothetical protein